MKKLTSLFENVYFETAFLIVTTAVQLLWLFNIILATGLTDRIYLPTVITFWGGYLATAASIWWVFFSLCKKEIGDFTREASLRITIFWAVLTVLALVFIHQLGGLAICFALHGALYGASTLWLYAHNRENTSLPLFPGKAVYTLSITAGTAFVLSAVFALLFAVTLIGSLPVQSLQIWFIACTATAFLCLLSLIGAKAFKKALYPPT